MGRVKPFWLTIGGGIVMIFGVIRSYSGMTGKLANVAGAASWKTSIETRFAFAFLMANAFLVLGGWICRRMTERELDSFPESSILSSSFLFRRWNEVFSKFSGFPSNLFTGQSFAEITVPKTLNSDPAKTINRPYSQ